MRTSSSPSAHNLRMKIDNPQEKAKHRIRQLIWLYFWLLLIEGALRKWVLPQLSNPLLLIRDPVAVAIYLYSLRAGVFPRNSWIVALASIAVLTLIATFVQLLPYIAPTTIALVASYGLHANYLHLPLIFIMATVLRPEDLRKIGWWTLVLLVPMSILMIAQFRTAPDAFLNRTAGGEGEMITTAMGKVRTAGPFSFVVGIMAYFSLATAYLVWGILKEGVFKNWLLMAASVALAIGIAVSGSRSVVGACGLVMASLLFVLILRPDALNRFGQVLIVVVILGFIVSQTPIFKEGLLVLTTRFNEAAEASEQTVSASLITRVIAGFQEPLFILSKGMAPLLGYGLGIGTNAGAKLLTGHALFLLTEDEWSRIFLESGPILGVAYVLWRCFLAFRIAWLCLKSILLGNLLPILLFSSAFLSMISGQFGQPTILGFVVFVTGLALAALKLEGQARPSAIQRGRQNTIAPVRGRSAYAAGLHNSDTRPPQGNGAIDR
jgi:hypothetical protein